MRIFKSNIYVYILNANHQSSSVLSVSQMTYTDIVNRIINILDKKKIYGYVKPKT